MRKLLLASAFVLTLAGLAVAQIGGFGYGGIKYVTNVSDRTINDENPLILIKYVGTANFATFDHVSASLRFYVGASSAAIPTDEAAADINVGDVCGSTEGDLLLTNGSCDTFGELVRVINANSADHGWVAVLVGALSTDTYSATTAGSSDFLDPAGANAKLEGGVGLYGDDSTRDELTGLFAPWLNKPIRNGTIQGKFSIEPFLTGRVAGGAQQALKGNPIPTNYIPFVQYYLLNSNPDSGTLQMQIYSLTYQNEDGTPQARLLYADAVVDDTDEVSSANYLHAPFQGDPGSVLLIRLVMTAAQTDTDDQLDFFGFYGSLD